MADQSQQTRRPGLGLRVSTNVRRNSTRETNTVQPIKPQINQPVVLPDKENVYPILAVPKASTNDKGKNKSPLLIRKKGGLSIKMVMENIEKMHKELEAEPNWIDTCGRMSPDDLDNGFSKDKLLPPTPLGSLSPSSLVPSPVNSPVVSSFHSSLMDRLKTDVTEVSLVQVHSPYPDSQSFTWKIVDIPISDDDDDF